MICKKCGAENEDWSEYCYKCKARLKPLTFSKVTILTAILAIVEGILLFVRMVIPVTRRFTGLSIQNKFIAVCILSCMFLGSFMMILFLKKKKRVDVIIADMVWMIFIIINITLGGSTMFCALTLLPVVAATVSVIPKWKDLAW